MILEWLGIRMSTNALCDMTALKSADVGLTCAQLAALFNKVIAQTSFTMRAAVKIMTLDLIRSELDAGRPVIPLISYREILKRQAAFGGGHFFVVRGYAGNNFYVNDPDWWGFRRAEGENFEVPAVELDRAIQRSPAPGQCVVFQT